MPTVESSNGLSRKNFRSRSRRLRREHVGEHQRHEDELLEQPVHDPPASSCEVLPPRRVGGPAGQVRREVRVAVNGAADEGREEDHVGEEGQWVERLDRPLVGLDDHVERPEGEVRDPDEREITGRRRRPRRCAPSQEVLPIQKEASVIVPTRSRSRRENWGMARSMTADDASRAAARALRRAPTSRTRALTASSAAQNQAL